MAATNCLRTAFSGMFLMISAVFVSVATRAETSGADPIAITGVTLIDGTGAAPKRDMTVRIENGRITSIAKSGGIITDAHVIDGRGRYLLPGFIDSNVHVSVYGQPARRDASLKYADRGEELALEFAQRALTYGVTTMRDSYGVLPPILTVRDRIDRGEVVGARLKAARQYPRLGRPFSLTFSLTKDPELSLFQEQWNDLLAQDMGEEIMDMTPEELRVAMNRYLDKGVDFIKYGGTSHFLRPALIGFSPRQRGGDRRGSAQARQAGRDACDEFRRTDARRRGGDRPDPASRTDEPRPARRSDRADREEERAVRDPVELHHRRLSQETSRQACRAGSQDREDAARDDEAPNAGAGSRRWTITRGRAAPQCRTADQGGVPRDPATDSFYGDAPEFRRVPKGDEAEPGIGTIRAVEGLVELGMTPMEAIVAGTKHGAAAARMEGELGTVETGKIADLVLLSADPLADIRNIEKVEAVIAQGKLVDRSRLPEHPLFLRKP